MTTNEEGTAPSNPDQMAATDSKLDNRMKPHWAWAGLISLIVSFVVGLLVAIVAVLATVLASSVLFNSLEKAKSSPLFAVVALISVGLILFFYFYFTPLLTAKLFDWRNFSYVSRWNFLPAYFLTSLAAGLVLALIGAAFNLGGEQTLFPGAEIVDYVITLGIYFVVGGLILTWTSSWNKTAGQIISLIGIVAYSVAAIGFALMIVFVASFFIQGATGEKVDNSKQLDEPTFRETPSQPTPQPAPQQNPQP